MYLDTGHKRRAVGRALLQIIAVQLRAAGCTNIALRVARSNPARAFGQRLDAPCPNGISLDRGFFDDAVYAFADLHGSFGLTRARLSVVTCRIYEAGLAAIARILSPTRCRNPTTFRTVNSTAVCGPADT